MSWTNSLQVSLLVFALLSVFSVYIVVKYQHVTDWLCPVYYAKGGVRVNDEVKVFLKLHFPSPLIPQESFIFIAFSSDLATNPETMNPYFCFMKLKMSTFKELHIVLFDKNRHLYQGFVCQFWSSNENTFWKVNNKFCEIYSGW